MKIRRTRAVASIPWPRIADHWLPLPQASPVMPGHRSLFTGYWPLRLCLFLALITGCASPNVNPPQARAKTGYVDFYADSSGELSWEVARFDDRTQGFRSVFSELEPPPAGCCAWPFRPAITVCGSRL